MITCQNVRKSFKGLDVLKDITLDLGVGKIVALLGPSGSGKSTLLRCIAHLEEIDGGVLTNTGRSTGLVFQAFHLFPHMTVLKNLTYAPLKAGLKSASAIEQEAFETLESVGLADKATAYPSQLSGGQKQRIAIARALMMHPDVLLFDEPTSALDPELVSDMARLIGSLKRPDRLIIIATHELRVAKMIADDVVFLDQGIVAEQSPTSAFFTAPASDRARGFLAQMVG